MDAAASPKMYWARAGAITYVVWGVLHLWAAVTVFDLGGTIGPGMVRGRVYQDAWNLFFFGVSAIAIAATLNWRNSRIGYWINLGVLGVADAGLVLFVVIPGYMPPGPGLIGPILWIIGLTFTTIALRARPENPGMQPDSRGIA
jgi:hypothetical protein